MHWQVHYRWKLIRLTGKEPENLEQCQSKTTSIKQAKKEAMRLAPNQLKKCKWRKISPHVYRLGKRDAYFRVDLEILGWTPPRGEPKPSLNPKIQEIRNRRNTR